MASTGRIGHSREEVNSYVGTGRWGTRALADHVRDWRRAKPGALAFAGEDLRISWADYDELSTELARQLIELGMARGERLAVLIPDGAEVHVAWLAAEKAGLVTVGIGARAGDREIRHLVELSGATAVLSSSTMSNRHMADIVSGLEAEGQPRRHFVMGHPDLATGRVPLQVEGRGHAFRGRPATIDERRLEPSELFMLNSTSGTTGLPKCVMHTQNRWVYFHRLAVEAADLTSEDVFFSALPAPFGFGLWTAHFTPTLLGAPTYLRSRFDADATLELLEKARVTVLAAVTTQLIMLLNSPELDRADLGPLRVVFTGGEAVPPHQAAAFEERTGATVLQFYGSNETGAVSRTTLRDDRQHRLSTAGRIIDDMQVRLVDPETGRLTRDGRGQPVCRGPATCEGYYADPDANELLYTEDGWMLIGDLVEIDANGYLTVVGRTSDIIIRGGKNISAAAVEAEVMTHPAVAVAAAVAAPDPVVGERVCVYVEPRHGHVVTLEDVAAHLAGRGVGKEYFPEHLIVLDALPRSSGGKVAKAELRQDIRQRIATTAIRLESEKGGC